MDNGLREFELLQKKYTRLRDNLDPKSIRSQIYGEVYNDVIEDAKKGIARAESRNENSGLHIAVVNGSACKYTWDNDTGVKSESRPWAGIKSRWIRTCTKCDKKEYYTNDGMFCGWFSTP